MDPLVIVLTVVAAILSLVLIVLSVQAILVLQEVRRSLERFNRMTEVVEQTVTKTFAPFQNMGGMMHGLQAGYKLIDTFATFVQQKSAHGKKDDSINE